MSNDAANLPVGASERDPAVFEVIRQGKAYGPMTRRELESWRNEPYHVLVDLVESVIFVWPPGEKRREVRLRDGPLHSSAVLDVLSCFAEHPGENLTGGVCQAYVSRRIAPSTFPKYIRGARRLLEDTGPHFRFILNGLTQFRISDSNHAYYANANLQWVVVRYHRKVAG